VPVTNYISSNEPTILVCSNTSLLEYLYLGKHFSPLFVTMDYDNKTKKAALRVMSHIQILQNAIGIKFP